MAGYLAVLFNFSASSGFPVEKIKSELDKCKDWLRVGRDSWLVYTDLSPTNLRDRLRKLLEEEDPTIVVLRVDLSGWSAYAKTMPREWLKKKRSSDKEGE
jgi:hypothetical protein